MKHQRWLRGQIRALEKRPVAESLVRDDVVLACPDKVRDRRIAPVGTDDKTRTQFALAAIGADAHAADPAAVLHQSRSPQSPFALRRPTPRPHGENRVEHEPPDRRDPPTSPSCSGCCVVQRKSSARLSILEMNGAPVAFSCSVSPSRSRNASASASKMCVESVSRGNVARSTSATFTPALRAAPPAKRTGASSADNHDIKAIGAKSVHAHVLSSMPTRMELLSYLTAKPASTGNVMPVM